MHEITLIGQCLSDRALSDEFCRAQIAKAVFFKNICVLLDTQITTLDALLYFLPDSTTTACNKAPKQPDSTTTHAFCYATLLYNSMSDGDWESASKVLDHYNLPLSLSSAKYTFKLSNDECERLLNQVSCEVS